MRKWDNRCTWEFNFEKVSARLLEPGLKDSSQAYNHVHMGYWPIWAQDGWRLAKFFFCVFMDLDFISVHKLAKKERSQYPAILAEQTWSIKDLLYGFRGNFACLRDKAGSPERARWLHLARSGSQSQREVWFILPAHGARHIISLVIIWVAPWAGKMT